MIEDLPDDELMARVIYGEARGESERGRQAVANVIMNRVKQPRWWGRDVKTVCLKPYQFSCLNKSDPNRALLEKEITGEVFENCLSIARSAIAGNLDDLTGNADSYQVVGTNAFWSRGLTPTITIGRHEFFRTA